MAGTRQAYSGGIVGYGGTLIVNCYNRSGVTANAHYGSNNTTNGTRKAGGICGTAATTIKNCYNTAGLTGGTLGGIRAETSGTVTNCYYLETCGGTVSGGTPKTAAAMKSPSFPVMLNSDSTVYVMDITPNVNDGYPIFGTTICEVFTHNASNIKFTSATLNGTYHQSQYWPGGTADVVGFEYKESSASSYTTIYANVDSLISYSLTNLQSGTSYDFRLFIQKNGVSYYGSNKTFTTQACDLQVGVTNSVTELCVGESASFTVSASSSYSNLFTYEWNNGGTDTSIHVSDGDTYTVTVHDTNGCVATASASVVVHPLPQGVISGSTSLCAGESTTLTASGANSYYWSTGATTPVITVDNSGTFMCTFTNSYGCTDTQSVTVSIFATPAITGNTAICDGGSTTLTATGGSSYEWSNGATTPSITVNAAGTYSVTATQGNCSASSNVTTTMVSSPTPTITGNSSVCQGESATLVANGGYSYLWNTGSTDATITVDESGTYTVTATNTAGCTSQTSVAVVVNPLPNITISGNQSICAGATATLTASGANSYVWCDGNNTASIVVMSAGDYSVTGTNSYGCINTATLSVVVNPVPQGVISGNTILCLGESTTLTASGANSYSWNTGSTQSAITVNTGGTYSCVFTNGYGCSSTESVTVMAQTQPTISGTTVLCQGNSSTLTAIGGDSYQWSNGDTTSSIIVQASGQYTVTAYFGNCSATTSVNVSVYPLPSAIILGDTLLCQGESTSLTANGGGFYLWNNGSTQPTIMVSTSGCYFVTVSNSAGCSSTASVTVTINPLPAVNISGNSSFCQGDNVTLTATGASTYVWSNASTDAAITVSSAGNYTVTGTDANGCSNTATKTVSVNPTYNTPLTHSICEGESYNFYGQNITEAGTYTHTLQTVNGCDSVLTLTLTVKALPTPSISGNTALCEGESTTLTANGGISYNWSNGSATNSINVAESGVYTVTATNVEGCTATASATVTVNPPPIVVIGGNTSICEGGSTTLTASGADTYSWSTGENTASVNISAFGIYTVTGTSAEGCSNTSEVTVLVSQLPNITITGETDICAGESTILTANGGESYLWSNGTTEATLTVSNAGTYQVIGYNEVGCNAMASATVNVWQPATSEFSVECSDSCYTWNDQSYCTSGDYTQTFQTIHGCDSVVTLHLTITVGIEDHNLAASMTVYPNPTTGIVNVQCTMNNVQEETVDFLVYDAFGRLLRSTDGVETFHETSLQADTHGPSVQTKIDLSHFAPGVYLIKAVADGNVVAVRKVIRN